MGIRCVYMYKCTCTWFSHIHYCHSVREFIFISLARQVFNMYSTWMYVFVVPVSCSRLIHVSISHYTVHKAALKEDEIGAICKGALKVMSELIVH